MKNHKFGPHGHGSMIYYKDIQNQVIKAVKNLGQWRFAPETWDPRGIMGVTRGVTH